MCMIFVPRITLDCLDIKHSRTTNDKRWENHTTIDQHSELLFKIEIPVFKIDLCKRIVTHWHYDSNKFHNKSWKIWIQRFGSNVNIGNNNLCDTDACVMWWSYVKYIDIWDAHCHRRQRRLHNNCMIPFILTIHIYFTKCIHDKILSNHERNCRNYLKESVYTKIRTFNSNVRYP